MRHPKAAPCDSRKSQGATQQLRTLRLSHIAPCDIALSHLAISTCRTLRLKSPILEAKITPTNRKPKHTEACLHKLAYPAIDLFQNVLNPPTKCDRIPTNTTSNTTDKNTVNIMTTPIQYAILQRKSMTAYRNFTPSPSVVIAQISTILQTQTANKGSIIHPTKNVVKSCPSPR